MVGRTWHGWTTQAMADADKALLREEILPGIAAERVPGNGSMEAVKLFAGEHYERAVVPAKARARLTCFDDNAPHYDMRTSGILTHRAQSPTLWSAC